MEHIKLVNGRYVHRCAESTALKVEKTYSFEMSTPTIEYNSWKKCWEMVCEKDKSVVVDPLRNCPSCGIALVSLLS